MCRGIPDRARRARLLVAATVLAAAGGVRAGGEPASGGSPLKITAEPPRLVLGRDAGAELRVAAPAHVLDLSFTATAGRVENVQRLTGGGFTAWYRPPAERLPQVAIVAATARTAAGLEDGWVALPLTGEGNARVRGEPGSDVTLRIGDRTFGPVRTSSDGIAIVPVVVPPGVREAHQGFRPIDLRIPDTSLLHAVHDRTNVRADREERVKVVAYVVAPHGAARRGDPPQFEPTRGTVSVAEREPGAFQAVWTLPPGPAGEERLSIRLPSAPASRATVRVAALAGPPALVAVSFDREALVAGGEAASVTARALDAAGNPVPAELALSARGALLSAVETRRPGEVVGRVAAGEELDGDEAIVTAVAPALGIAGSRALPLRPAAAAAVQFRPRELVVRSDGVREAVLRVTVEDRFGNPVSLAPIVTASRGRVVEVAADGPGTYAVRYVGPAVTAPTFEELVARVGSARAEARPLLAPPSPVVVSARAGVLADAAGRFVGPSGGVAAERAADVAFALRRATDVGWRIEAEGFGASDGTGMGALLAGIAARRDLGRRARLAAALTAGPLAGSGTATLAARLSLSLGLERRWGLPFLEASLLGARAGGPGAFAAIGLSAGVRFGLGGPDVHDPDRR